MVEGLVAQLARLGISGVAQFLIFVAIYVATAVIVCSSGRRLMRAMAFALNQVLTICVIGVVLKVGAPEIFPWKETAGVAGLTLGLIALGQYLRARRAQSGESPKDISRRARKLAEVAKKAAAASAAAPAPAAAPGAGLIAELPAQTASDISRRIDSHSRKRAPVIRSVSPAGFGKR